MSRSYCRALAEVISRGTLQQVLGRGLSSRQKSSSQQEKLRKKSEKPIWSSNVANEIWPRANAPLRGGMNYQRYQMGFAGWNKCRIRRSYSVCPYLTSSWVRRRYWLYPTDEPLEEEEQDINMSMHCRETAGIWQSASTMSQSQSRSRFLFPSSSASSPVALRLAYRFATGQASLTDRQHSAVTRELVDDLAPGYGFQRLRR